MNYFILARSDCYPQSGKVGKELNAQLLDLNRKRMEWLRKSAETAKPGIDSSFDAEVLKSIENQLNAIRNSVK